MKTADTKQAPTRIAHAVSLWLLPGLGQGIPSVVILNKGTPQRRRRLKSLLRSSPIGRLSRALLFSRAFLLGGSQQLLGILEDNGEKQFPSLACPNPGQQRSSNNIGFGVQFQSRAAKTTSFELSCCPKRHIVLGVQSPPPSRNSGGVFVACWRFAELSSRCQCLPVLKARRDWCLCLVASSSLSPLSKEVMWQQLPRLSSCASDPLAQASSLTLYCLRMERFIVPLRKRPKAKDVGKEEASIPGRTDAVHCIITPLSLSYPQIQPNLLSLPDAILGT